MDQQLSYSGAADIIHKGGAVAIYSSKSNLLLPGKERVDDLNTLRNHRTGVYYVEVN